MEGMHSLKASRLSGMEGMHSLKASRLSGMEGMHSLATGAGTKGKRAELPRRKPCPRWLQRSTAHHERGKQESEGQNRNPAGLQRIFCTHLLAEDWLILK